jgi:hypothetical protein
LAEQQFEHREFGRLIVDDERLGGPLRLRLSGMVIQSLAQSDLYP